jgi:hypothetical protein
MKRTLSQIGVVDARRRRCVVADCPRVPNDSNVKCSDCLSKLCNMHLCTNPCSQGVRGQKLKRCEQHSQRQAPRRMQQSESFSLSQGMSQSQTRVIESQQASSTQEAKVVRQFSQHGIIEQETVTSTTQTLTQTWRKKIVDCKSVWTKSECSRLMMGAEFDQTCVAFPAIRIALREKENKFEDVEDCTGNIAVAAVKAVNKLRELHTRALKSMQIPKWLPDHQQVLLKLATMSGTLPGTLVPADLLLMLQSAKRAIFEVCNRKETHPLYVIYSMAAQSLGSLLSTMEDFIPCFDQTSPVNRVFHEQYHYYQHINDLIGPQPEEKEPPPNPHSRFGFLYSKKEPSKKEPTQPYEDDVISAAAPEDPKELLAALDFDLQTPSAALDSDPKATSAAPEEPPKVPDDLMDKKKSRMPVLKKKKPRGVKNGLPLPNDEPDLLSGLTRLHFIELGTMLGLNGTEVWRVLNVVQNLQHSDEDLFALVLSGQLMVRCAERTSKTLKEEVNAFLTVLETMPDGGNLDMSYIASPCVWMHRGITDHGNPCARVRLNVRGVDKGLPETKVKTVTGDIDCNVFLPHQCMELLITACLKTDPNKTPLEKDAGDLVMLHYQRLRQLRVTSKVRGYWAQMDADANRHVFGIPLHSRLLNHPAFEPLKAYTEEQNMSV